MKDEIKKILDYFRKFATIRENTMISEIEDYITNLQEEVNKLTTESTQWEERTYCWQDRAEDLEITIERAINILENNDDEYQGAVYSALKELKGDKD